MTKPAGNRLVPSGLAPVAILGVTASGKSSLAMRLARSRPQIELVSVDSMQVYRGMDIGTAKPTKEERREVTHHVLDLVEPNESFDLSQFQSAVGLALRDIAERGHRAVLVGGTGLYLRAVVDSLEIPGQYPEVRTQLEAEAETQVLHARLVKLDPAAAAKMESTNRRRVIRALEVTLGSGRPFSSFGPGLEAHPDSPITMVGLSRDRVDTAHRIQKRYDQQMAAGFLAEVERLHRGPALSRTAAQALGYRELLGHLDAVAAEKPEPTLEQALDLAVLRTRQFAVRQDRWFRRDPRITWVAPDTAFEHLAALVDRLWT